jgi:glutamate racemase
MCGNTHKVALVRPSRRLMNPIKAMLETPFTCPEQLKVKVGLFDSGVGGLSILRALRSCLPKAQLLYVADSGHAPYGEKPESFIIERALLIAQHLLDQGAQLLVVACNTATAAAVHALRQHHPHLPIIGIEPGVKPAVSLSPLKKVGVMATPGTLASAKFAQLVQTHRATTEIVLQPCPGLAAAIETGDLDTPALRQLIATFCAPLKAAGVDTVVLGCTHYPFVAPLIAAEMGPRVKLVDTADAVARHTVSRCESLTQMTAPSAESALTRLWTSGSLSALRQFSGHWLGDNTSVEALPTLFLAN